MKTHCGKLVLAGESVCPTSAPSGAGAFACQPNGPGVFNGVGAVETHRFGADLELLLIFGEEIQKIQTVEFLVRPVAGDLLALTSFTECLGQQLRGKRGIGKLLEPGEIAP
jgi:hypothetical protein